MQKILRKRMFRDFRENVFRYAALLLLIIFSMYIIISLIAAAESVIQGTKESQKRANIEDGEFHLFVPLSKANEERLAEAGAKIQKMFYLDFSMKDDSVVRVFQNRMKIDKITVEDKGRLASASDEIVLEKRYCEAKKIRVGDTISLGGHIYKVVGIGTVPDYDAPYRELSDTAIDSKNFGLAFVTPEVYKRLRDEENSIKSEEYLYAYQLSNGLTDKRLKEILQDFTVDATNINDPYFKEYWKENGEQAENLTKGIDKLYDAAKAMKDGLEKLSDYNGDLNEATSTLLDSYLEQVEEGLGLNETLTEDNFDEVLTRFQKNNTGILALSAWNSQMQLESVKEFKDGITDYTKGEEKIGKASGKLVDGLKKLKDAKDDITKYLETDLSNLTSFMTREENMRIGAAADDQLVNKNAGLAFGVVLMVLFTYVISVFVIHEIEKDSSVIGALYALGLRKNELLKSYLMLPVCVTFLGGILGFVIALTPIGIPTQMADVYAYFSVPDFKVRCPVYLSLYALFMPPVIAAIVNYIVIKGKLSKTALSLMRGEVKASRESKINLDGLRFMSRFQIRQMIRESRTGITVVLGMFFSLICLMLALNCLALCDNIQKNNKKDTKFAYMYTYKYPTKEVPKGGEEAVAKTFRKTINGYSMDVTLLGIQKDNPYFDVDVRKGMSHVAISSAMAQRFELKEGESFIVVDAEADRNYAFTVSEIVTYAPGLFLFMDIDSMREMFSLPDTYFNVVFSDKDLKIDSGYLYGTLSKESIEKSGEVFMELMSAMIVVITVVSMLIFCVVMYLMMKVMLERSSSYISLMKVFGFRKGEIRKMYLNGNFYIVAVGALICIPASKALMNWLYPPYMIPNVAIGIDLHLPWWSYLVLYFSILGFYEIVNCILVTKVRKVSLAQALKNRE